MFKSLGLAFSYLIIRRTRSLKNFGEIPLEPVSSNSKGRFYEMIIVFLDFNYFRPSTTSTIKMADSFVGRFVVESKDNYDGFMKGVGE